MILSDHVVLIRLLRIIDIVDRVTHRALQFEQCLVLLVCLAVGLLLARVILEGNLKICGHAEQVSLG